MQVDVNVTTVGSHAGLVARFNPPAANNFYLAMVSPATGEVLTKSFHRDWLFNGVFSPNGTPDGSGSMQAGGNPNRTNPPLSGGQTGGMGTTGGFSGAGHAGGPGTGNTGTTMGGTTGQTGIYSITAIPIARAARRSSRCANIARP